MSSFNPLTFEKMSEHYDSLLKSGLQSDVVLVVGEKKLCAHKVVLSARSPVFSAMFAHPTTKEAQESRVEIVDMDEEVLESFVRYIYTGKVDKLDQFAGDLLIAADKYQLASLKSICEAYLLSVVITTETVSDLLTLADMYQITVLTSKCLRYITDNATEVKTTEGWNNILLRDDLVAKFKLLNLNYSEEEEEKWDESIALQDSMPFKMASFDLLIFKEMSNDYESLLESGKLSDVVLVADDKELHAHKVILSARSAEFAAMFATLDSTKKAQDNRVQITDVDVEVLKVLIKYIYTGKVEELELHTKLFLAADKYRLDCIKSECEQHLASQISVSFFSDLLIFANTYHVTVLTSKCLDCISRNVTQMIDSEEWDKIAKTDLLSKIHERLNLCFAEQIFLSQITTESFADILIFADTYQVIELYMTCLEYIAHNLARLVTSEEFDKIVANADLLDKLCASLNFSFSEEKFFSQITTESVVNLLIFAYTYQVTVLYRKCLEYFTNNFAKVVHQTSNEWMKIAVRADLLAQLYDHLHLEYSKAIANDNREKKANSIESSSKKKKQKKPKNCTSGPDLNFEKYLLKYSNVINGKEEMMDAVLVVGDTELKVHKSILSARSPVFATMFAHDTINEEHENRVQITNVDVKVLKVLIKYIYSGKVERLVRYLAELLLVADKYQVVGFKSICEQQLLSKVITIKSVLDLVIIADMHQFAELYAKCIDYIANNAEEVMYEFRWNKKILVKFDLLAKICEQFNWNISKQLLWCPINVELVCDLLILAVMDRHGELAFNCIDYITNNRTQVMATEGWKKLLVRADLLNMLFEELSFKYAQFLDYKPNVEYVNYQDNFNRDDDYDDGRGFHHFGYSDSDYDWNNDPDFIRYNYNSEY